VLQIQSKKRGVRIARIAGALAGAWAGMFMMIKISTANWIQKYMCCRGTPDIWMHEKYESMWVDWLQHVIPADAYNVQVDSSSGSQYSRY
jgi:hypothetical protein